MRPSYRNRMTAAALVVALQPGTSAVAKRTLSKAVTLFTLNDKVLHGGFSVRWVSKDWATSRARACYAERDDAE